MPPRRCLMLDLGGCITNDPVATVMDQIAARHDLDTGQVRRAERHARRNYRHGPARSLPNDQRRQVERDYWEIIRQQLQLADSAADLPDLLRSSLRLLDPRWPELLKELAQKPENVLTIVSNNLAFIPDLQLDLGLRPYFAEDHIFLSCDLGYSKADAEGAMFAMARRVTEVPAERCLFVDDRIRNIFTAVRSQQIPSILFPTHCETGVDYLRPLLQMAGFL